MRTCTCTCSINTSFGCMRPSAISLEVTINNILKSADVSSWNIKGDNTSLQVWIRFNMDDEDSSGHLKECSTTYRRVPPGQRIRDRDRAMAWSNDKSRITTDMKPECEESCANDVTESNNAEGGAFNTSDTNTNTECSAETSQVSSSPSSDVNNLGASAAVPNEPKQPTTVTDLPTTYPANNHININNSKTSPRSRFVPFQGKRIMKACMTCSYDFPHDRDESKICVRCLGMICVWCLRKGKHHFHNKHLTGYGTVSKLK